MGLLVGSPQPFFVSRVTAPMPSPTLLPRDTPWRLDVISSRALSRQQRGKFRDRDTMTPRPRSARMGHKPDPRWRTEPTERHGRTVGPAPSADGVSLKCGCIATSVVTAGSSKAVSGRTQPLDGATGHTRDRVQVPPLDTFLTSR